MSTAEVAGTGWKVELGNPSTAHSLSDPERAEKPLILLNDGVRCGCTAIMIKHVHTIRANSSISLPESLTKFEVRPVFDKAGRCRKRQS